MLLFYRYSCEHRQVKWANPSNETKRDTKQLASKLQLSTLAETSVTVGQAALSRNGPRCFKPGLHASCQLQQQQFPSSDFTKYLTKPVFVCCTTPKEIQQHWLTISGFILMLTTLSSVLRPYYGRLVHNILVFCCPHYGQSSKKETVTQALYCIVILHHSATVL